MKKIGLSIFLCFSMLLSNINVFAIPLIPSGESIGIKLDYDGIVVTGSYDILINNETYNPLTQGININDIITHVNNSKVTTVYELSNHIKENVNNNIDTILTIQNETNTYTNIIEIEVKNNEYHTGLYVKDSIMGVGTMTYYNPSTNSFGSLGHAMNDIELNSNTLLNIGSIYLSEVTGIIKGNNSQTGQKMAYIDTTSIGDVNSHSTFGIYGVIEQDKMPLNTPTIETASIDEIELGQAYFLTVIEDNIIEECTIEITDLKKQNEVSSKGITFEIIDQEIIDQTNGIIQGMSGSPIIQNNKIIGCVTHVSSNNSLVGYGLYIDWMLEMDAID